MALTLCGGNPSQFPSAMPTHFWKTLASLQPCISISFSISIIHQVQQIIHLLTPQVQTIPSPPHLIHPRPSIILLASQLSANMLLATEAIYRRSTALGGQVRRSVDTARKPKRHASLVLSDNNRSRMKTSAPKVIHISATPLSPPMRCRRAHVTTMKTLNILQTIN